MCILCCNCCNPTMNTTNELTINATSSHPLTLSLIKMCQRGRGPKSKNSSWWSCCSVLWLSFFKFLPSGIDTSSTSLRPIAKKPTMPTPKKAAARAEGRVQVVGFGASGLQRMLLADPGRRLELRCFVMSRISLMKQCKMPPKFSLQMFRPLPVTVRHLDTRRMSGSMELVKVGQVPSFGKKNWLFRVFVCRVAFFAIAFARWRRLCKFKTI